MPAGVTEAGLGEAASTGAGTKGGSGMVIARCLTHNHHTGGKV